MSCEPWILGIAASHNGGACLIKGKKIIACIQEERITRYKRTRLFPSFSEHAIRYCLTAARIKASELNLIVVCTQDDASGVGNNIVENKLFASLCGKIEIIYIPHHYGHALCAFGTSGYKESAILVVDGMGSPLPDIRKLEKVEDVTGNFSEIISLYHADGKNISVLEKHFVSEKKWIDLNYGTMPSFRSLGGMYAAVSQHIFGTPNEAGKVMGLASFGTPKYHDKFYTVQDKGFNYSSILPARFNGRYAQNWNCVENKNLASSVQLALDEAILHLTKRIKKLSQSTTLCYGGGVALNCVTNTKLDKQKLFSKIFIHPASEDSGTAIGAAIHGSWLLTKRAKSFPLVRDSFGYNYNKRECRSAIGKFAGIEVVQYQDFYETISQLLKEDKVISWFQGGSEFGPRALGFRSILCNPARKDAKNFLNTEVKHRESFRPFAPVVLEEEVGNWFNLKGTENVSPFMLKIGTLKSKKAKKVPGVVHVDGTARFQTVNVQQNEMLYHLIKSFARLTKIPMLLNTSFNVMNEPLVETPQDALHCFMATAIDYCVLGRYLVKKI